MGRFRRYSLNDKIFYIVITSILSLILIVVLYPCIYVVSASFSSGAAIQAGKVVLFPVDFSLEGYKAVFNNPSVWTGFGNSIFYTVTATTLNIVMTITAAYCLSRKDLPGANFFMLAFTFTMFFSGGLIPNYMLMKGLHLTNTRWVLIVPTAISAYNLIVARTFIVNSIPTELLDASMIDGCSDFAYFMKIVVPLSKPIIAILVLFYGVTHWNTYFNAMIYLNSKELFPLTIFLKEILMASTIDPSTVSDPELQIRLMEVANVIKYSLIVVTMVPIMMIYPLIQKYFVKGVMIGSVKG